MCQKLFDIYYFVLMVNITYHDVPNITLCFFIDYTILCAKYVPILVLLIAVTIIISEPPTL